MRAASWTEIHQQGFVNYAGWIGRCIEIVLQIRSFTISLLGEQESDFILKFLAKKNPSTIHKSHFLALAENDKGWEDQSAKTLLFKMFGVKLDGLSAQERSEAAVDFIASLYSMSGNLRASPPRPVLVEGGLASKYVALSIKIAALEYELNLFRTHLNPQHYEASLDVSLLADEINFNRLKLESLERCIDDCNQLRAAIDIKLPMGNEILMTKLRIRYIQYKLANYNSNLPGSERYDEDQMDRELLQLSAQVSMFEQMQRETLAVQARLKEQEEIQVRLRERAEVQTRMEAAIDDAAVEAKAVTVGVDRPDEAIRLAAVLPPSALTGRGADDRPSGSDDSHVSHSPQHVSVVDISTSMSSVAALRGPSALFGSEVGAQKFKAATVPAEISVETPADTPAATPDKILAEIPADIPADTPADTREASIAGPKFSCCIIM